MFNPVKKQSLEASTGGTDFSELFLYFSFFLIVASLLLVGLLFRLNIDRRAEEIGLLLAVGYRRSVVRWLLLGEGCVLAGAGAVAGSWLAMLYARLLLQFLAALWPGQTLQSFLRPHFTPLSLVFGAGGAFLVSVLTILWAVFSLGRLAPSALLAGQTPGEGERFGRRRKCWGWRVAVAFAVCALGLLASAGSVRDHEMRAMTFFGSGSLLLSACLSALWGWMRNTRHRTVDGHGLWSVARLGIRNAARYPSPQSAYGGIVGGGSVPHCRRRGFPPPRRWERSRHSGQRRFQPGSRIGFAAGPRSEHGGSTSGDQRQARTGIPRRIRRRQCKRSTTRQRKRSRCSNRRRSWPSASPLAMMLVV